MSKCVNIASVPKKSSLDCAISRVGLVEMSPLIGCMVLAAVKALLHKPCHLGVCDSGVTCMWTGRKGKGSRFEGEKLGDELSWRCPWFRLCLVYSLILQ
jgi:hypothetical protein